MRELYQETLPTESGKHNQSPLHMLVAEVPLWEPRAYTEVGRAPLTILCWWAGRVGSGEWGVGPLGGPHCEFGAVRHMLRSRTSP